MNAKYVFLLLMALLLGCSKQDRNLPGYSLGSGDAGAFVLDSAAHYGARPVRAAGLPTLMGDWRYMADQNGVQIELVGDRFRDLQVLLQRAFGPPAIAPSTNADGKRISGVYAAPNVGAAIQFGSEWNGGGTRYTEVVITSARAFK